MSYQVLARKWRPTVFQDLVGQKAVVRVLTNSLKHKRLHPALIFAGPRGTGKTSTARILAKSLTCPKAQDFTPCNQCPVCEDINHSRSLDIVEIDGASNNGVEAIRQLTSASSYIPSGSYKVYIIDEVHMLSTGAFNALLKTLEEPPPHVLFIMATTEMRKIPATVLSRCQILPFQPIADSLIYQQLKKISEQEKTEVEEDALWMLVREAKGSLRDAQGLLDQMITFCQNKFNSQDVNEILGLTDRSILMECLEGLLKRSPTHILNTLPKLETSGGELFLQNLLREIRNLLLLKLSQKDTTLIPLSEQEKDQLLKWAKEVSAEDLQLLFDMALTGSQKISWVQDSQTFLEMLLLKMSQAPYIENIFGKIPATELLPADKTKSSLGSFQAQVETTKDSVGNEGGFKSSTGSFQTQVEATKGSVGNADKLKNPTKSSPTQAETTKGSVGNADKLKNPTRLSPSQAETRLSVRTQNNEVSVETKQTTHSQLSKNQSSAEIKQTTEIAQTSQIIHSQLSGDQNPAETNQTAQASRLLKTQNLSEAKQANQNPTKTNKLQDEIQQNPFVQRVRNLFSADIVESR